MKNLKTILEHLNEMGKVDITNINNRGQLQEELENRGIETRIEYSDRDYLILTNKLRN